MSSSNSVAIRVIPETTYGVTPATGSFTAARFTSEKISSSPGTTESKQIRTDRMSSGQIVTSLGVGGDLSIELAKEPAIDQFLSSAMYSDWDIKTLQTVGLTIDHTAKTITRATGSFIADGLVVGDFLTLGGFTDAPNNTRVMVAEIPSATVIRFVGPKLMVDGTGTTTTYIRADKLTIGTTKKSFSMEKAFTDLNQKAILYRGLIASAFSLDIKYGDLINGSFTFVGNGSTTVQASSDFMTNGRTIIPAATTDTFNGSIDMPFVASSAIGVLDDSGLAIQDLKLDLNNNDNAQNVIGSIAPIDYSAGTAAIAITISAYLKDSAWSILQNKLTQTPFALGFSVKNAGGFYAFYIPAIQVSFDDPSSGGQNQDVILDMKGTAKVGANGESALVIYRG